MVVRPDADDGGLTVLTSHRTLTEAALVVLAVAMVLTTRIFVYYFVVEVLFGVPNHYGLSRDDATRLISDILTRGILRQR